MAADDRQAELIAAEWGVSVELLNDTHWELDTIDGNDGEVYGYIVRFDDETDSDILEKLGIQPGDFTRRLSLNAFDDPDYNDDDYDSDLRIREGIETSPDSMDDGGTFSIYEPLPDLPHGDAYLMDDKDRILTDEKRRPLIATGQPFSGTLGSAPLNEYFINGPSSSDQNEAFRRELFKSLDRLEAALHAYGQNLAPRNHNRPPELIEDQLVTLKQIEDAREAARILRAEAAKDEPEAQILQTQATILSRIGSAIWSCVKVLAGGVAGSAAWEAIVWVHNNPKEVHDAMMAVAETASQWSHQLSGWF